MSPLVQSTVGGRSQNTGILSSYAIVTGSGAVSFYIIRGTTLSRLEYSWKSWQVRIFRWLGGVRRHDDSEGGHGFR